MSGICREGLRSRGRNVKADTTTSLLPGGGAGLLVERGGGPVKRTLSTSATSPSRWYQRSSFIWRVSRASRWLRLSSSAFSRAAASLVCAPQAAARRNREKTRRRFIRPLRRPVARAGHRSEERRAGE